MNHTIKLASFIVISLIFFVGCRAELTEQELPAHIESLIAEKKYTEAEIELKNFIKKHTDSQIARALFANLAVIKGNYQQADYRYSKVKSDFDTSTVDHRMESWYMLSDFESIVDYIDDTIGNTSYDDPRQMLIYAIAKSRVEKNDNAIADLVRLKTNRVEEDGSLTTQLIQHTIDFQKNKDLVSYYQQLKSLSNAFPEYSKDWLFLDLISSFAVANQRYDEAIGYYQKFIKLRPSALKVMLSAANAHILAGGWENGDQLLNQVLQVVPEQPIANQLKAVVLLNQQQLEQAKIHLEKAVDGGLATRRNLLTLADIHFNLKNYEQAINYLEKGLVNSSRYEYANYHNMLVYARAAAGHDGAALEDIKGKTIADMSDINNIASLLAGLKESGSTINFDPLTKAVSLEDDVDPAIELEFSVFQLQANPEKAIPNSIRSSKKLVQQYVKGQAKATRQQLFIAKSFVIGEMVTQQRYSEAESLIDKFVEKEPDDHSNTLLLAELYAEQGRFKDAAKLLVQNFEHANNAQWYVILTNNYIQLKQGEEALSVLEKGLKKFKFSLPLVKQFVTVENVFNASRTKVIENIFSDADNNLSSAILLNMYHAMHKNWKPAIKVLVNLSEEHPRSVLYWYTLAQTYLLSGDKTNALKSILKTKNMTFVNYEQIKHVLATFEALEDQASQLEIIERHIAYYPSSDKLHMRLAALLIEQGQSARALRELEKRPINQSELYFRLKAQAAIKSEQHEKAKEIFKVAYSHFKSENVLIDYAQFLMAINEVNQAKYLLTEFNRTEKETLNTLLFQATLESGNVAVELYKKVIAINPNNIIALSNLSTELKQLGRDDEARGYDKKVKQLSSNS